MFPITKKAYRFFDISNPASPFKVAYYDTHPGNTDYNGFFGCWGTYPYLPSGTILASDDLNGLFVMQFAGPVPVEFSHFGAVKDGQDVRLDWVTEQEHNNAGFEVERALSDGNFEKILEVRGAGNSDMRRSYTAYDRFPKAGSMQYRLKQLDLDGKTHYSEIVFHRLESRP